ncbi:MAG: hypothetical protein EOS23_28675 [Mesorhizobium sp.]|uniref:hypothetical protein n=1 Tax=unclassified Mesorhizobium TaxID=325217 RepID=UPI000FD511CA|nr:MULTISPECIES: hypothetical protein [unclassified Mesorhizobium]RUV81963.1 hypothetical protein EOA88_19180 [Mesorhizobium sp. M5C.F.Ca.IN.020.14.1.1]RUV30167.1 hypothetical protein EOA86_12275 [Mesorhizobium sp. M5C.F.Ca.IN.020.32.2.1]RWD39980.1 MAG: hypothetical protein EOS59_31325 [Mesorhizobium sp.]RWE07210.1 MAG: hypothetical protein EOS23_28675 [Mesorhizobium sp.]RWE51292.1 MAG: hypothetical protein EOS24_33410 [Mesorhizobium sp.]
MLVVKVAAQVLDAADQPGLNALQPDACAHGVHGAERLYLGVELSKDMAAIDDLEGCFRIASYPTFRSDLRPSRRRASGGE